MNKGTSSSVFLLQYASDDLTGSSEKKSEKRRSFLQQPKTYTSRLPTYEDSSSKTYSSKLPTYDDTATKDYSSKLPTYEDPLQKSYSSKLPSYSDSLSRSYSSDLSSYEDKTPKTQPIAIPKPSPSQISTPETSQADNYEFFIGDRVRIGGIKTGTLLYFGTIHVAPGLWCGIALDEADGTHDGLVNDVRYFTCRKKHGIFAPVDKVTHIDTKVVPVAEPPPKVSEFRGKSKVCATDSLREYMYHDRSREYIDDREEEEEPIPGLDEDGIIRDDDDDEDVEYIERSRRKRKLPKLPTKTSHHVSRLHYLRQDTSDDEFLVDEAAEKLKMIAEDVFNENELEDVIKPFHMQEEKFESPEPQHSAAGSSGAGSDSWSLTSKEVLEMCNGSGKEYFNITFDGESESKTSTQEPSEESPSPEFIFDQEMIEDGEFAAQPMNISRDSSLGLLTSLTLEKGELLFDLTEKADEEDVDGDMVASQETLKAKSVENMHTPEKYKGIDESLDFDEVSSSTPFSVQEKRSVHNENLNSTFTKNVESSQIRDKPLNSTFTLDENSSQKDSANTILNDTYTLSEKGDNVHNITHEIVGLKAVVHGKGAMVDSGISMKGSMSESGMIIKSTMADSSVSMKNSLVDSTVSSMKPSMVDSGIASCRNSMIDSGSSSRPVAVYNVQGMDSEYRDIIKSKDLLENSGLDDQKLMSDLKRGHEKKERPISFMSTTSADTGMPDVPNVIENFLNDEPFRSYIKTTISTVQK